MSKDALLNEEVRNYLKNKNIEEEYTSSLNKLMNTLPEEPFNFISQYWKDLIPNNILVKNIFYKNSIDKEFNKTYIIYIELYFKGNVYSKSNKRTIINGNIDIEQEINDIKLLEEKFNNLDIKNFKSWIEILENNEISKNVYLTVNIIFLMIFSEIKNIDFKNVVHQEIGYLKNNIDSVSFILKLFKGNEKNKFDYIFLIIEADYTKNNDILEYFKGIYDNAKKNIINSKAGYSSLKIHLDGSIVSFSDTISDNIKYINELIDNSNENFKSTCNIGINIQGTNYFNKELQKYEFENTKKPSDPEEIEDLLVKICIDKPRFKYIIDPFLYDNPIPWHRLNKKLKEKNLNINILSKYINLDKNLLESFEKTYTMEDFPNVKQKDFADKLNENLLKINYNFIDFIKYNSFLEIYEKTKELDNQKFILFKPVLQSNLNEFNILSKEICKSVEFSNLDDFNLYFEQLI